MSRKSKYSAEQKLAILNELTRSNISEMAKKYAVGKKLLELGGIYINIRALMAYDLLTIIIDIQRNLNYLWSNSIKNQTSRLKYSRSSMG